MAATPKAKRTFMKKVATMQRHDSEKNEHKGVAKEIKNSVMKTAKKAGDSKSTKTYLRSCK